MRLEYFEMIDKIEAFDPIARTMRTSARVPEASPVFEGHFPGFPIMPGALLLEVMAQSCGFLALSLNGLTRFPFLAAVRKAKFRRFVPPGTMLTAEAAILHEGSGFAVGRAALKDAGVQVSDAEITLAFVNAPPPEFLTAMRQRAKVVGLPGA